MLLRKSLKIVIVDNYPFLRESLRHIFEKEPLIEIVGEADDAISGVALIAEHHVDLVILEPSVPKKDGIDVIKQIASLSPSVRILVFTMDINTHYAFRMLRAGASGWLPKTVQSAEVLKAVASIAEGKVYLPGALQKLFAERYVRADAEVPPEETLTDRELQVLRLLALGKTNREIAELLFIGVKTVDTHRANLLRKLNLRNNADITRFAIHQKLIS